MTPLDLLGLAVVAFAMTRIFGPLAAAVGDRIRGRREPAGDARLGAEVELLQARLTEVEERLDFAERLLTNRGEADQLPGGAHR